MTKRQCSIVTSWDLVGFTRVRQSLYFFRLPETIIPRRIEYSCQETSQAICARFMPYIIIFLLFLSLHFVKFILLWQSPFTNIPLRFLCLELEVWERKWTIKEMSTAESKRVDNRVQDGWCKGVLELKEQKYLLFS